MLVRMRAVFIAIAAVVAATSDGVFSGSGVALAQEPGPPIIRPLSLPGYDVAAATDGTGGDVLAAWAQRRRGRWSLPFSERADDGRWSPPGVLARQARGESVNSIDVDAGRDGTVTIVWSSKRRHAAGVIRAVTRAPGGTFGRTAIVGRGSALDDDGLKVATDDRGGALVIWGRVARSGAEIVAAVRTQGGWLGPRMLGHSRDRTTAHVDAAGVGEGVLAAAWLNDELDDRRVRLARVSDSGGLYVTALRLGSGHHVVGDRIAVAARPDGTSWSAPGMALTVRAR